MVGGVVRWLLFVAVLFSGKAATERQAGLILPGAGRSGDPTPGSPHGDGDEARGRPWSALRRSVWGGYGSRRLWGRRRLLEAVRGVVDAGLARQRLGRWWAGRLGLLLIPALFSPPSACPLSRVGFCGGAGRICVLLDGFAVSGGR